MKEYLGNELQFKIEYYCLLICLLKKDCELLRLVQSKSSQIFNYLQRNYRLNKYNDTFIKQLFTNNIMSIFDFNVNLAMSAKIIQLLFELGRNPFSQTDIWLMGKNITIGRKR